MYKSSINPKISNHKIFNAFIHLSFQIARAVATPIKVRI